MQKYLKSLKKGGILVIDSSVDKPDRNDITVYQIPIIETANEKLKKSMVANIVALGALNKILNLVSEESLEKAVLDRVPKGTEELNRNALIEGRNLIE
jgi:2-oxoglutarate ferredoxin oxidoreductase, gamma subunit (EC 1.2.7.3)